MGKAKVHPDQFGFLFDVPAPAKGEAALAGFEQRVNAMVGSILNTEHAAGRPRAVIAAEMSVVLGEEVTKAMLDAYASPARIEHKVPFSRLMALIVVTGRQDMIDPLMREGGMAVLIGEEVKTARVGHLTRELDKIKRELRQIEGSAPLIDRGEFHGRSRRK